jgi:hypothetical protein
MKTQTFILLGLVAVEATACSRTALDNAATGANACGDKVLDGYLFDGSACPNQGFASLPGYQSTEGLGCHLDVYLISPEQTPVNDGFAVCRGEPVTSKCLLDGTGFTGFIVNASTGVADYPRASLIGSMQTTNVCAPIAKCAPMRPECEECQRQAIFVPCQVTVE